MILLTMFLNMVCADVIIIVASKNESLLWIDANLYEYKKVLYSIDNPHPRYFKPKYDKGFEACMYLDYK